MNKCKQCKRHKQIKMNGKSKHVCQLTKHR
jgi:hypothetical protein